MDTKQQNPAITRLDGSVFLEKAIMEQACAVNIHAPFWSIIKRTDECEYKIVKLKSVDQKKESTPDLKEFESSRNQSQDRQQVETPGLGHLAHSESAMLRISTNFGAKQISDDHKLRQILITAEHLAATKLGQQIVIKFIKPEPEPQDYIFLSRSTQWYQ